MRKNEKKKIVIILLHTALFVSPPDPYAEILSPSVMVVADGASGGWLGQEDGVFVIRLVPWLEEAREPASLSALPHVMTQ